LVFKALTNQVLLRKFKEVFNKDQTGKSRHWPAIEEGQIKEIFDAAKATVSLLLDEFKKVVIPRNLTVMQTPNPDSSI
jgi:hypothetical protein